MNLGAGCLGQKDDDLRLKSHALTWTFQEQCCRHSITDDDLLSHLAGDILSQAQGML